MVAVEQVVWHQARPICRRTRSLAWCLASGDRIAKVATDFCGFARPNDVVRFKSTSLRSLSSSPSPSLNTNSTISGSWRCRERLPIGRNEVEVRRRLVALGAKGPVSPPQLPLSPVSQACYSTPPTSGMDSRGRSARPVFTGDSACARTPCGSLISCWVSVPGC